MKYILKCNVLEVNQKSFKNKEGNEQPFFTLSVHQFGEGVGEISCTAEIAQEVKPGEVSLVVDFRNGKPKATGKL